jgi:ubiquinone/menaquinone biosynthesis C-methylase UbiE
MDAVAGSSMMIGRLGIKKGMKILDAGCGPGRITIPIAKFVGSEGEVTALDIQQKMLEMVKKKIQKEKLQNIKTIHGGLGFGLLKKDMFDRALLVTVLGEIPAQVEALKEIHESLKSGGFLSVIEVLPDPHYQRVSKVRRLASQAGFREHDYSGNWRSYTIIFVKN